MFRATEVLLELMASKNVNTEIINKADLKTYNNIDND